MALRSPESGDSSMAQCPEDGVIRIWNETGSSEVHSAAGPGPVVKEFLHNSIIFTMGCALLCWVDSGAPMLVASFDSYLTLKGSGTIFEKSENLPSPLQTSVEDIVPRMGNNSNIGVSDSEAASSVDNNFAPGVGLGLSYSLFGLGETLHSVACVFMIFLYSMTSVGQIDMLQRVVVVGLCIVTMGNLMVGLTANAKLFFFIRMGTGCGGGLLLMSWRTWAFRCSSVAGSSGSRLMIIDALSLSWPPVATVFISLLVDDPKILMSWRWFFLYVLTPIGVLIFSCGYLGVNVAMQLEKKKRIGRTASKIKFECKKSISFSGAMRLSSYDFDREIHEAVARATGANFLQTDVIREKSELSRTTYVSAISKIVKAPMFPIVLAVYVNAGVAVGYGQAWGYLSMTSIFSSNILKNAYAFYIVFLSMNIISPVFALLSVNKLGWGPILYNNPRRLILLQFILPVFAGLLWVSKEHTEPGGFLLLELLMRYFLCLCYFTCLTHFQSDSHFNRQNGIEKGKEPEAIDQPRIGMTIPQKRVFISHGLLVLGMTRAVGIILPGILLEISKGDFGTLFYQMSLILLIPVVPVGINILYGTRE